MAYGPWYLAALAGCIITPIVTAESILHHFYPRNSESHDQILSYARELDWDVWYSSRYDAPEHDRMRIRAVPDQLPLGFEAEMGGRIDVYNPGDSSTFTVEASSLHPLLKKYTTSIIDDFPRPTNTIEFTFSNADTPTNSSFHTEYHTLPEILHFIMSLADMYPDIMTIKRIGLSAEGRDLLAVEITKAGGGRGGKKPRIKRGFVIGGAQHAREWIATSTILHILHSLVHPDGSLHPMLDNFNFYLVPIPNPDGYVWTWEGDRFWYKNRQILGPNIQCVGVDTNRNWGYKWKPKADSGGPYFEADDSENEDDEDEWLSETELDSEWRVDEDDNEEELGDFWEYRGDEEEDEEEDDEGDEDERDAEWDLANQEETDEDAFSTTTKPKLPTDPCSHWFPGSRKWQAPEVNDYANYVTTLPNLISFLDLRSYGQMVSTPFSFSCTKTAKDAEDLMEAALGGTSAMKRSGGVWYATGTLCEQLYPAPGNIIDWMYKIRGIKFSYSIHLRDTGTYGFSLPPRYIQPVSMEMEEMVKSLGEFILFPP